MTVSYSGDPKDHQLPPDMVRRVTRPLLSAAPGASAVTVALHRDGRRALVARGRIAYRDDARADAHTRFEIGSLTKTFTALLFAEQAARGELGHHDRLADRLPPGTGLPTGGAAITLTHLATHTSGLPLAPPGLPHLPPLLLHTVMPRLMAPPYEVFTTADLLRALPRSRLRAGPGTRVRYSNFGVALLGQVLAHTAGGVPYPALLAARVLDPLRLRDTDCSPTGPPGTTQAAGYHRRRSQPPIRMPGMAAAGAARASAHDLLTLAEGLLDPASAAVPPSLRTALADVQRPRLRLPPGNGLALVWNIRPQPDGTSLRYHAGGTFGGTAFVGFSPSHGTALVALANTAAQRDNHLVQEAYNALLRLTRQG
ncbi:serine hydrolase domain-containing protein [Streptomyces sp. NPDC005876]|uniref:serine hydrolase domain-containing protein n=1 Tax=unclassified Streptomyces TaxID=2593676 RepID=UPI0033F57D74